MTTGRINQITTFHLHSESYEYEPSGDFKSVPKGPILSIIKDQTGHRAKQHGESYAVPLRKA
jgi:hypothetical protein